MDCWNVHFQSVIYPKIPESLSVSLWGKMKSNGFLYVLCDCEDFEIISLRSESTREKLGPSTQLVCKLIFFFLPPWTVTGLPVSLNLCSLPSLTFEYILLSSLKIMFDCLLYLCTLFRFIWPFYYLFFNLCMHKDSYTLPSTKLFLHLME